MNRSVADAEEPYSKNGCRTHPHYRAYSLDGRKQDECHPFKGSIHSEEEDLLEDNFRVLTLVSRRKEGPDLETASLQWQQEVQPGENSAKRLEQEQMLGHLQGSTGVEQDSGSLPLQCEP
ncbi:hypothetical protein NDU88_004793 [Pleurodeles waltl]|uniref:Uncharacterized protein n=1 Tax=Pleurodeles waltl TaxID=8319 RepID=A0AAV7WVT1_PLEWA|nr:hypothetical protein NDU88_004793 [Pleurodeles waltl]